MPEGIEHLHGVQIAIDAGGSRPRVIDDDGRVRERLGWPSPGPGPTRLPGPDDPLPWAGMTTGRLVVLAFSGRGRRPRGPPRGRPRSAGPMRTAP